MKRKELPVVHLFELNMKASRNELEKKEGKFFFQFPGKVLATGVISFPLSVKAVQWSKRAEEKIKAAGGEIASIEK